MPGLQWEQGYRKAATRAVWSFLGGQPWASTCEWHAWQQVRDWQLSEKLNSALLMQQPQDEVILVENVREDGSAGQVVFRLGGTVTAEALEKLCIKVRRLHPTSALICR
jgi:hypothetical protein